MTFTVALPQAAHADDDGSDLGAAARASQSANSTGRALRRKCGSHRRSMGRSSRLAIRASGPAIPTVRVRNRCGDRHARQQPCDRRRRRQHPPRRRPLWPQSPVPRLVCLHRPDLITPDGTIIPANTNLGPLFNIAGTDDTPGPGVTIWAGWHVLESIDPRKVDSFNLTVAVVDDDRRIAFDRVKVKVDKSVTDRFGTSGNGLTQNLVSR